VIDLLPTDIEQDLRTSVRDLLRDQCDLNRVIATYDGDRTVVGPLWKSLATDLGLAGLLVPESRGGAGATAREAAVVLEELGRAAAPVPYLTSAVIATVVLDSADGLLAELAAGERTACLVVPWSTAPWAELPALTGSSGQVTSVAGALESDVLLVPVRWGDAIALHALPREQAVLTPVVSLDMSRPLADVQIADAGSDVVVARAEGAIRRGLEVGAALMASEQVGVARWCLEETLAYLKVRKQFGRVVGGFQAIKHRLADLYADVESASAAATYAARTMDDLTVATAVAQSYCADVAVRAAEEAVQLHGGIGMTWEHPAHVYLKRAKADQIALGTPGAWRAQLAGMVEL